MHTPEEVVLQDPTQLSESGSELTNRHRISRRRDLWTPILVPLVIGTAMLLGALVGFRFGWQESNLGLRAKSPNHRLNVAFKTSQNAHVVSAARELQPISAAVDECDQPVAAGASTDPPRGGLTICQQGRVIFRLPHSALSPTRGLQTSQSSPGLQGDLTRDSHTH